MFYFYNQNSDFIYKDVSLTGGTSITVNLNSPLDIENFKQELSKKITEFSVREISDFNSGVQIGLIIESPLEIVELQPAVESALGYKLVSGENASIEFSGSSLSEGFYKQLIYAIILSFSFMALVIFFIFGGSMRTKILCIFLTLIPIILFFSGLISVNIGIILSLVILLITCVIYFKYSFPSITVIFCALQIFL
jgi:preprotein translocase subunit SecF